MNYAAVFSVHVGKAAPLGPDRVLSGFVKDRVTGAIAVGPLGLEGDEQADRRVHGGPEKAVYGYAVGITRRGALSTLPRAPFRPGWRRGEPRDRRHG